jgi:quercetin dioxygenase-like cupin family protein
MAISHAAPGEVVDVRPLGATLALTETKALVMTKTLEVIRMVVPAGKEIPTHKAKGAIVVQCLEGRIAFTACGKTHDLEAGQLLYLLTGEPHSLRGIEDGSLLLTILCQPSK